MFPCICQLCDNTHYRIIEIPKEDEKSEVGGSIYIKNLA